MGNVRPVNGAPLSVLELATEGLRGMLQEEFDERGEAGMALDELGEREGLRQSSLGV